MVLLLLTGRSQLSYGHSVDSRWQATLLISTRIIIIGAAARPDYSINREGGQL